MTDLFDYPNSPGFKEGTTSKDAAAKIESKAETVRAAVLQCFLDVWPSGLTVDEVSDLLAIDKGTVRPRCSELVKAGKLKPSDARRPGYSKLSIRVWVATRAS